MGVCFRAWAGYHDLEKSRAIWAWCWVCTCSGASSPGEQRRGRALARNRSAVTSPTDLPAARISCADPRAQLDAHDSRSGTIDIVLLPYCVGALAGAGANNGSAWLAAANH